MTDPRLLEVPRELKPLIDMCLHFSIESGLIYRHFIWVPTDDDLQKYPHVFFTSPDIWDVSVLDHGITPAHLEDIHQEADDSLLQDSMFDEFGDLHQCVMQHLDVFWDSGPTETGKHTVHAHLHQSNHEGKIGHHSGLILDGNPNKLSKTPTRLPHALEVLSLNMITSRNISSPGILFSTIPGGMNQLLTLSPVTHLPSMMEVPWPSSLLARTL